VIQLDESCYKRAELANPGFFENTEGSNRGSIIIKPSKIMNARNFLLGHKYYLLAKRDTQEIKRVTQ
jgi:hypothetical protein